MRTKLVWCTIWALSAVLLVVSVDTIPDPPAVNPHTSEVKAPSLTECPGSFGLQTLNTVCSGAFSDYSPLFIVFARDCKPKRPGEWIVLTGLASDSSPPAV